MKSNFQERRQARIQGLVARAAKHEKEGLDRLTQARKLGSFIPFGQPILVGHHSEKGDRRFRAKIVGNYDKGFSKLKYAESLEARAEAAERNNAIFSDDPEAIQKLKEKIDKLEKAQTLMKAANKIIKSKKADDEKINQLIKIGLTEKQSAELLKADFCGRIGFASYALTNNNANINTAKKRLDQLIKQNNDVTTEFEINDVRIVDSVEDNRLQLYFPSIPTEELRNTLKRSGFRWSPSIGAWQKHRNNYTLREGKDIANKFSL